ncbi:MAG: hypothetical protein NT069_28250 [Planctomycetota bacterium]|nr:hypothetical protein [Planctomycetota bacterium]
MPLREVFGWLATETGVNLHIDNKRIEDGNLSADLETEVSLRCDDLKAGDVLELFLEYYGLDYDWNDGVIVIAPKESFEPTTQIFDVKELYTSSLTSKIWVVGSKLSFGAITITPSFQS